MAWGTPLSTTVGGSIAALRKTQLIPEAQFVRRMGGGEAPVQEFLEDNGQSFEAGQWVRLTTDGDVEECAADDDQILGIANRNATGVAGSVIPVTLGLADVVFLADSTTPANVAQAIVGDRVPLDVTAGVHTIDENDPATAHPFQIIGLPQGATTATHPNYGKVFVIVVRSQVGQIGEEAQASH